MTSGRRLAPRLATSVKITYKGPQHAENSCHSLDLSMRGMFLQLSEPFTPQEWLEISFQVKLSQDRKPVQCVCQVMRVLPLDEAQSYGFLPGVAVEFRKFLQGQTELRTFLAERLSLSAEELGEPALGPVPSEALEPRAAAPARPASPAKPAPQHAPPPPVTHAPPSPVTHAPPPRAAAQPATPHPPPGTPPGRKKAVPERQHPSSDANFESPPMTTQSRRAAGAPSDHPAEPVSEGPNKQWTRQDWEAYFASMRRDNREMHSVEDEDAVPAADYRRLALLGLKTALLTVGAFLLIYALMRVAQRF